MEYIKSIFSNSPKSRNLYFLSMGDRTYFYQPTLVAAQKLHPLSTIFSLIVSVSSPDLPTKQKCQIFFLISNGKHLMAASRGQTECWFVEVWTCLNLLISILIHRWHWKTPAARTLNMLLPIKTSHCLYKKKLDYPVLAYCLDRFRWIPWNTNEWGKVQLGFTKH
jgi:hypothetical protein